jgi:hypothetical protein
VSPLLGRIGAQNRGSDTPAELDVEAVDDTIAGVVTEPRYGVVHTAAKDPGFLNCS